MGLFSGPHASVNQCTHPEMKSDMTIATTKTKQSITITHI